MSDDLGTLTISTTKTSHVRGFALPYSFASYAFKNTLPGKRYVFNQSPFSVDIARAMRFSCIAKLFLSGDPLAITLAVPRIIIDTLKGKIFRSISHFLPKNHEIQEPGFTHVDPSCSVPIEILVSRVGTPLNHGLPNFVGTGVVHTVLTVKRSIVTWLAFCRRTNSKMVPPNEFKFATNGTSTYPPGTSRRTVCSSFNNVPAPKFHSSHIFQWFHTRPVIYGSMSMISNGEV